MKIAIPVDNKDLKSNVSVSFGRSPYLLIYNTDSKQSEFIDNSAATSQGGAGIKTAQVIVDSNVQAIITPRCGENAAKVLDAANIKIYKTSGITIKDNLQSFVEGKLVILQDIHSGFHGHSGH